MEVIVSGDGRVRCVYSEAIDVAALGPLHIRRASFVEPDESGGWTADLAPVGGPILGPFSRRSLALAAEAAWLSVHWLWSDGAAARSSPHVRGRGGAA